MGDAMSDVFFLVVGIIIAAIGLLCHAIGNLFFKAILHKFKVGNINILFKMYISFLLQK